MPHGSTGLLLREISRARVKTKRAHACADRATGDDYDFLARASQRGDLRDDLFELRGINLLPAVREDAGAELDDEAADILEQLFAHATVVAKRQTSVESRGTRAS